MILVSPAEPPEIRRMLGDRAMTHRLPESLGADFVIPSPSGRVAVQRKTVPDLLRSLEDGRLAREMPLLKQVPFPCLMVEGRPMYTSDGHLLLAGASRYTKTQVRNLLRSVAHEGIRVEVTDSPEDTVAAVLELEAWHRKLVHRSLRTRPKTAANTGWGARGDREWGVFILQGFPGVGPVLAEAIFDRFGRVPLAWTCTRKELMEIEGVGPKRVEAIYRALE